jgi:DNA-binding response OmpR family regulator
VLETYLRHEGYRTERAADGRRALELWRAARPNLILLDLMLPGLDGFEVARRIRAESGVPIIMLTARDEEVDKLVGLGLGADDYVTKPYSPREVVARVQAVLRRATGAVRAPEVYRVGQLEVDLEAYLARCAGEVLALTPVEVRLLAALARDAGAVKGRRELLTTAGADEFADERSVDSHVKNLRQKMGACAGMLETVRGVGYRLVERA